MAPNYPPIVAWSYAIAFLLVLTAANAGKTIRRAQDTPAVPPASLDAIATCSADNWGMPNQKRPPYRTTYQTDIQQACKAAFHKDNMRPMAHVLENATVNHYMNNKDFDAFIGIDMVPDNHNLYKVTGIWGHSLEYKHVRRDYMKAATCENQLEDGSTWTVTRIGPMKTRGGYDWVQVGWDNLWDMRGKLKEHPHGIYVLEQFSGAVTADGTRLGHPPIHIHHIHVGPAPGVRQRADSIGCVLGGQQCYDPTRVFEHHGDYQCTGVPDGPQTTYEGDSSDPSRPHRGVTSAGMDCLTESIPDGYGKLITFPLGLEGDINDVRPPNATVLEWYYQLSARWVPKLECSEFPQPADDDDSTATPVAESSEATSAGAATTANAPSESSISHLATDPAPAAATTAAQSGALLSVATSPPVKRRAKSKSKSKSKSAIASAVYPRPRAMSFHNFAGPGDLNAKQSSFVFTYQSPTDVESIFWYTGRMHHSGTMLRLKQHAHNIIYKESIFFAASPEQLGLTTKNKLMPDQPYHVVRTKEAGFASNVELKKFLLENLRLSHQRYQAEGPYGHGRRSLRYGNASDSDHTVADSGPRAICQAIESMETVDGFKYDRREPTCCVPWTFTKGEIFTVVGFNKIVTEKSAGLHQGNHPSIPATFPGHIGWWISFDTHEVPERSHYSLIQYTNNPDVQFQDFTSMHEDRIMFMLNGGTAFDPSSWKYTVFRSAVYAFHHPIVVPLCIIFAVLLVRACMYLRRVFAFVITDGELDLKNHIAQD